MAKDLEIFDNNDLKTFGDDYIKLLVLELRKSDKVSSGRLIRSLDYRVVKQAKAIQTLIDAERYMEIIDKGRKPGTYPPINEISKWASLKGISQSAVFPIARSIYKFGIKPTNILSKTSKGIEQSQKLTKKMEDAAAENVANDIIKNIKDNKQ